MNIAIVGGGAAGFFAAICIKENYPDYKVTIFEKSSRVLNKVKVSGGGRCNVTNASKSIAELCKAYPRGGNSLKKVFYTFNNFDAIKWFEAHGVELIIQEDNCVFPKSQNSQTIIDCFLNYAQKYNIQIETNYKLIDIEQENEKILLHFFEKEKKIFDKLIIAIGGISKLETLNWLKNIGHIIIPPIPSLFSFEIKNNSITNLSGIVIENTIISVIGTKHKSTGTLLITHWGLSGPAILKLSSIAARELNEKNYQFSISINWVNQNNHQIVIDELLRIKQENINKNIANTRPYGLQERLWKFIVEKSDISATKKWNEIGKTAWNKLVSVLTNDIYYISGYPRFKEEFVTCGGVALESVDLKTMQSKIIPNLYFAGEILDIDGLTGGYNFQNAWSTAYIAAKLL